MTSLNRPDKITLDAYSDPQLEGQNGNGIYNRFTNVLRTPLLNVKGVQLLNANFINSSLQLNDQSQLMFFYYASNTQAGMCISANLRVIRLLPSSFVPAAAFTAFTKNKYYNSVAELVVDLNFAAQAGGDSATYNPSWVANQVVFYYNQYTRKISVAGNGTTFIAPAAADDPNVLAFMLTANRPAQNGFNSGGTYATATLQPYVPSYSMNARLGFAMSYLSRGLWWGSSTQIGCATSIGVPSNSATVYVEADANPILLGVQNVGVYISISTGGGVDATGRKNLIGTIPIEVAPLHINSYTLNSVEGPSLSTPNEVYEITVELLDDTGAPFFLTANYNSKFSFSLFY